ncbi:MAG: TRAP transporter large permease subunit [SAR324 cluster bacterium]|nr:TRAP transporter large permease subunit [SAR324 cluster bacterium]
MSWLIGLVTILSAILGTPLFIVLGGLALILFHQVDSEPALLIINLSKVSSQQAFVAIPLFTFAGYLLAESKAPERIIRVSRSIIGWFPGGLGIVGLLTCSVFTAFTGASGVTIIALGGLLFPALVKDGYGEKFSLGHITASGSPGVLIFPSIPLILYSIISGTSFDDMKVATLLPYMLMITLLSLYCIYTAHRNAIPRQPVELSAISPALWDAKWELLLPVIVFGGIYGGFLTAAESAVMAAIYTLIIEVLVHRDITIKEGIPRIVRESMVLVGGIFLIMGAASAMSNYMVDEEIPDQLFEMLQNHIQNKYIFLGALTLFLLVVGAILDIFSAILVVVPLIVPVANSYGIDPVHLGVIFLANLELGYCTPPVGMNLFISSFRFNKPVMELYNAALPFLVFQVLAVLIVTFIPWFSLVLLH